MAINFTPDQQKVIDLHGCNILVSAAAGSGKTAVLVERIIQMICDPKKQTDIDRLLIMTFTSAAAAEMRERISQAIAKRIVEEPDNGHLQKQATLLHNAQITTIDSFCLFLIRNHFNDIGLDPAFRVADMGEVELLKQEVMAAMLEERFASGNEDFLECVEFFCPDGRERTLEEHIHSLFSFAMSQPFPKEWLKERRDDYVLENPDKLEEVDWALYFKKHICIMLQESYRALEQAVKVAQEPAGPYMYGEMLDRELESVEKVLRAETLEQLQVAVSGITFGRLPSKPDPSVDADLREKAKGYREQAKKTIIEMQETYFAAPVSHSVNQMQACAGAVKMLAELCLEFYERLQEAKREKKILDFSDMEHMALEILWEKTPEGEVPTLTAMEYRQHFAEVLVDEYQDSNIVQEYLIKAVSGEDIGKYNRFMVGDVKQSIYKFRLAEPRLFLEKYDTYRADDESSLCRRIDLSQNFRSRKEVIDTVNHVFSNIMGKDMGGIVYDDKAALHIGATYPENTGCESELILMEKPGKDSELSTKELEALGIARKIQELCRTYQVTDKETRQLRNLRYSDIVILLRSGAGWDETFKSVLEAEGIPAHISTKTGYFSTSEIQTVMQFLKVLDNPLQDVPLFGVLKSVFGGFSDEEIAMLRAEGACEEVLEERFLYVDVEKRAAIDDALGGKCASFVEKVERYRGYTAYMPIRKLLQTMFDEFGYLYYVSALPAGEQRLANVEMLLEKAGTFEKSSYYGLYHFIRYMEQMRKYDVDMGEANTLDENANLVRIMTIHKSKGLEFPVTFVAGLGKMFNLRDTSNAVIVDMDFGIGTNYVDTKRRVKNKTLRKNAIAIKMKAESLAEEIRVLYVALTRAKEKLIMIGSMSGAVKKYAGEAGADSAHGPLSYAELYEGNTYLDWILPIMKPTQILTEEDLGLLEMQEEVETQLRKNTLLQETAPLDEQIANTLKTSFSYRYPHENLAGLYTKTTVSELKMAAMEEKDEGAFKAFEEKEVVPYIPKFMQTEEKVSGTTRGNAYHKVMELLDLAKYQERFGESTVPEMECEDTQVLREKRRWLETELSGLVESGLLSVEYRQALWAEKILTFLDCNLAKRMAVAQRKELLWKEQPFVYGISADRLSKGETQFPSEETVLIQGIVDVFFEEEDGLVVADYKTDAISAPQELVERYRVQLDYYQEALEHLTGKKVKEKILYSFSLGCEIVVD